MANVAKVSSADPIIPLDPFSHSRELPDRGTSTLERSTQSTSYEPSKPVLDPPTAVWNAIHLFERLEGAANRHSLQKEHRIDQDLQRIQSLHLEQANLLEASLKASEDVAFWGVLEDMTSTVMSGVSLYFGFSALAVGAPLTGGILITSGILSLTNLAFKHGDLWSYAAEIASCGNETVRYGIETYAPPAIGIMAAAASLCGVYTAWNLPAEASMKSTLTILQTVTGLSSGLTAFAKGNAQARFSWTTADVSALQTKAYLVNIELENLVEEVKDFHQEQNEVMKLAAKLIQEADRAVQATQQPV